MSGTHLSRRIAPFVAFVVAVGLVAWRAVALSQAPVAEGRRHSWVLGDFREAIYYPVRAFIEGNNPYDTAAYVAQYPVDQIFPPYSPLTLLLHLPFGLLPVDVAQFAYFFFTLVLTVVLAALALRMCGLDARPGRVLVLATAVLASRPGHWNLLVGQATLEMVLAAYAALYLGRDRPWLAAAGLAVATAKPTYGAPVALLMAAQGQWRGLWLGAGLTALLTLVPTLALAREGIAAFMNTIGTSYASFAAQGGVDPTTSPVRVDIGALLARLFGAPLPRMWQLALTLTTIGVGAIGVRRAAAGEHGERGRRLALLVACLTLLTASYQQSYNTLLLVAPLVALAADRWAPVAWTSPVLRRTLLALLLVPAVNYFASFTAAEALAGFPRLRLIAVSANGAALFAAYAISVAIAFRAPSRAGQPR